MTPSANSLESQASRNVHRTGAARIAILADDLTGACDSGVAFLARGRRVRVVLDAGYELKSCLPAAVDGDRTIWALTTETRDLPPEQAVARVADSVAALTPILGRSLLFKKIDSAARGNFGVEISAALRCSGAALALVAPAFPTAGRTVASGILTVRDWSGQDTAISLRDLFPHEGAKTIEVLPTGSAQQLEQGIAEALAKGTRVLLCDSTTQDDLEKLAAAALHVQSPLLWAGSAGLAHALAGTLPAAPAAPGSLRKHDGGSTLLFVGTEHAVTHLQVAHLEQNSNGIDRAIHRIPYVTASGQDVVAAFSAKPVAALILTGGDTAAFVLRSLGASGIALAGEIARGIPWGFVEGGMADGCVVVTKSGGFGERDALVHAFEFCERRSCDSA